MAKQCSHEITSPCCKIYRIITPKLFWVSTFFRHFSNSMNWYVCIQAHWLWSQCMKIKLRVITSYWTSSTVIQLCYKGRSLHHYYFHFSLMTLKANSKIFYILESQSIKYIFIYCYSQTMLLFSLKRQMDSKNHYITLKYMAKSDCQCWENEGLIFQKGGNNRPNSTWQFDGKYTDIVNTFSYWGLVPELV